MVLDERLDILYIGVDRSTPATPCGRTVGASESAPMVVTIAQ